MKKKVGNKITAENANWSFSGKTPKNFDTHINKSIPLYKWTHEIGLEVADFFLTNNSITYDIGCSTGTFVKKLSSRVKNKKVKIIGIDEIPEMIKKAKLNCRKNKNIFFYKANIESLNLKKNNLITSFFTMSFIKPSKRQIIFNKVFKSLNWGGGFLFFDKVRAPDARFQDMMSQIYNEFKISQGFSSDEILSKSSSLKGVLEPFSSKANIMLAKRAGFKDIMTVFKFLNFEGFLAIK